MTAAILSVATEQEGIVAGTTPTETAPDRRASAERGLSALPSDAELDHLLVISGLSGAGKSQAGKVFEDLGYTVVDNLPAALLEDFLALRSVERDRYRRSALVLDIRAGDPAPAIERAAAALDGDRPGFEVIFLEASDETLVNRFSETRHRHPIGALSGVQASIAEERRRLARTRELSDHVVDTSGLSIGQLKDRLWSLVPHAATTNELRIDIVTFGFKYGIPLEADLVFDVRFMQNPYYIDELRQLSGLTEAVRDYVLGQPVARQFLDYLHEFLDFALPAYVGEGKTRLTIALGCTGGYHRSIALAEELARWLREQDYGPVAVFHRELERA